MSEPKKEHLPQLRMALEPPSAPPALQPPATYLLREFGPGDEEGWAQLLNANGELGEWNLERVAGVLAGGLVRQFFAVAPDGSLVACAGVHEVSLDGTDYWEIGWVAAHPRHRGLGLGALVTGAAARHALSLPPRPIMLRTDDFRLAAIKVYLRLGFRPLLDHPSYPERWRLLASRLGPAYGGIHQGTTR